jgi:fructoselysine-6-P-deglycase FrlB-like protein
MRNALSSLKPDRIIALGCGTSYHAGLAVAETCQAYLGIPAFAYDAYHFGIDLPPGVDSKALVISISQSGGSLTSCLAQETARKLGVFTVGISGNPDSRLAKGADYSLIDPYLVEIPLGKTRSYLSSCLQGMLAGMMTAGVEKRDEFILQARAVVKSIQQSMERWEESAHTIAADWA